ncbi:hypothetical protein SteCoe_32428 [Stentor coeruleus]|uniref:RING-type domain-containing protein n=1 Tax=Stentor coeruleus TaxID=5963 RepID=A0A1R2AZ04_9CILI|nr:hypothetical protein SteCoe_32428 [Stentor coeruleus]
MSSALECKYCHTLYDPKNKVPLVLKCGDSICMDCIVNSLKTYIECPICNIKHAFTMSQIKDMPVNKALLLYIQNLGVKETRKFKPQENKKDFPREFVQKFNEQNLDDISPFMVDDIDMKCKRIGCDKEKYQYEEVIYEYCSIECFEFDKSSSINSVKYQL